MGGKVSSAKEAELVERTKLPIGQNIPEFSAIPMPLVEGLLSVLMSGESSTVGEEDFIKVFTLLHQDTSVDEKISCLLKVFDRDADGLVGQTELYHVMRSIVGHGVDADTLEQSVGRVMAKYDSDNDGKLQPDEFNALLAGTDVAQKLVVYI